MCRKLPFRFRACCHVSPSVWRCSGTRPCQGISIHQVDPFAGECLRCLANPRYDWPLGVYRSRPSPAQVEGVADLDLVMYAEGLVDWATLWMQQFFDEQQDAQASPSVDTELRTHILRTYLNETHCRGCGKRRASLDDACVTCAISHPNGMLVGNSVARYRRFVANSIYNNCLRRDVEQGHYDAATQAALNSPSPGTHNNFHGELAIRIPPVTREELQATRWDGFDRLFGITFSAGHDEGGLEPEHFHYTACVGHLLMLIVYMTSQDSGLQGIESERLLEILAPLLRHSDDKRACFGPYSDHKQANPSWKFFRQTMLRYLDEVEDTVGSMKRVRETSCKDLFKAHVEHIQAYAKSFPSQEKIMESRLRHYGTITDPDELAARSWICPICREAANNQEVLMIRCGHRFHTQCLIDNIFRSGTRTNKNLCALCRRSFDNHKIVEDEESEIYDNNWSEVLSWDVGIPLAVEREASHVAQSDRSEFLAAEFRPCQRPSRTKSGLHPTRVLNLSRTILEAVQSWET